MSRETVAEAVAKPAATIPADVAAAELARLADHPDVQHPDVPDHVAMDTRHGVNGVRFDVEEVVLRGLATSSDDRYDITALACGECGGDTFRVIVGRRDGETIVSPACGHDGWLTIRRERQS